MPRMVGMWRAAEMVFTGDIITADVAPQWGLVSRVVPGAELVEGANEMTARIAISPGHAVRLSRRLLREGMHMRLDTILEMSAVFQALSHQTDDHRKAVAAFLEKKPRAS